MQRSAPAATASTHAPASARAGAAVAQPRLRRWLRTLHQWLGLSAGTVFAMFGVTGTVLTYQPELLRWQHPELFAQPVPDETAIARGLQRLLGDPPPGITGGDLPRAATPYWQLFTTDHDRLYMDAEAGRVLLHRTPSNDWLLWLRDLHTHLLAGHTGEQVAGVFGLVALFLLASGLYLWWPRFGGWWPHLRWFARPPVRRWLSWHRSLGTCTLPLLLLVTLTGTAMVYGGTARTLLGLVLADAPDPAPPVLAADAVPAGSDGRALLAAARSALPDAELARFALPGEAEPRLTFRARSPREWHPYGRSLVWVDRSRNLAVGSSDATALSPAARASHAIYPLHMGGVGGPVYRVAVAASGLLPLFLLVTGTLLWLRRRPSRTT